eukprot:6204987-Pleurochrysis_carterae.AAC.2
MLVSTATGRAYQLRTATSTTRVKSAQSTMTRELSKCHPATPAPFSLLGRSTARHARPVPCTRTPHHSIARCTSK